MICHKLKNIEQNILIEYKGQKVAIGTHGAVMTTNRNDSTKIPGCRHNWQHAQRAPGSAKLTFTKENVHRGRFFTILFI